MDIGNSLGNFLVVELSFIHTKGNSMERVLVNIDLSNNLLEYLDMRDGRNTLQPLDYEGVLFKCHKCHQYGHTLKFCKFPYNKKNKKSKLEPKIKVMTKVILSSKG